MFVLKWKVQMKWSRTSCCGSWKYAVASNCEECFDHKHIQAVAQQREVSVFIWQNCTPIGTGEHGQQLLQYNNSVFTGHSDVTIKRNRWIVAESVLSVVLWGFYLNPCIVSAIGGFLTWLSGRSADCHGLIMWVVSRRWVNNAKFPPYF